MLFIFALLHVSQILCQTLATGNVTEGGNGIVSFCDFPLYSPQNGCLYPFPDFSDRYNYSGVCSNGVWQVEGDVFAAPLRNITICGSSINITGTLVVPSSSSLLLMPAGRVSASCVFVYGGIHLHYPNKPLDNLNISLPNILNHQNCIDLFTTTITIFADNVTVPCQQITITNFTDDKSFSFCHQGFNFCNKDYKNFVIAVSIIGSAMVIGAIIYIVSCVRGSIKGEDEENGEDED